MRSYPRLGWRLAFLGPPALMLLLAICAPPVAAHPLGNFTINLYSRLEVGAERIDITYVVDMAEIPTYQEFGSATVETRVPRAYVERKARELRAGLRLQVDERAPDLAATSQAVTFHPGQGGLVTTRIDLHFVAMLPRLQAGAQRAIAYEDTNFAGRLGWHEVVVQPAAGVRLARSDAPATDTSDELRSYPKDMLSSPSDVRSAHLVVAPGGNTAVPRRAAQRDITAPATDRFAALIMTRQLSPQILALALLAALGLGGLHALSPGHGKTIVGAYLVGARGTARHALFLGLTVTTTHTLGVFALGLVTLYASRYVLPEQLYPWLGVLSGAMIVAMGLTLLRQRLRAVRFAAGHAHMHSHDHDHEHGHEHHDPAVGHTHGPQTHTHVPPGADGSPLSWRSLLALGISGGLIPCPSALVVMLSAIALGRIGFGLVLIVAFSFGLAGALTGIGLLFVYGGHWLSHVSRGHVRQLAVGLRFMPIASALFVTAAGFIVTGQAMFQAGLLR